jgi:hypothetical protein
MAEVLISILFVGAIVWPALALTTPERRPAMRDDHPAEQYRAVMAELDVRPPPDPPPPPPAPRPVAFVPLPPATPWWRQALLGLWPVIAFVLVLVVAFLLYRLSH